MLQIIFLQNRTAFKLFGVLLAFVLTNFASEQVSGHGMVHEQIAQITQRIARHPDQAELYMKRAELYRLHRNWPAALRDLEYASTLPSIPSGLDLQLGRTYLEAGQARRAKRILDRFVLKHPDHARARVVRARSLVEMGRYKEAAEDYTQAIARMDPPQPEYFLERAKALRAAGSDYFDQAIAGLDEGQRALGSLVPLQMEAIDIELARGRFDAALIRLDSVIHQSPRKEQWLVKKAQILARANRLEESKHAWLDALTELEKLPEIRRRVRATQRLEAQIRAELKLRSTNATTAESNP